jgi:hypothetical protein
MKTRTIQQRIEALRITLEEIERTPDPSADDNARLDLKRILQNRIVELELRRNPASTLYADSNGTS